MTGAGFIGLGCVTKILIRNRNGSDYLAEPYLRGWLGLAWKVALAIIVLPLFLLFIYMLPFVKPVSTLMLKDMVLFQDVDRRWVPIENVAPVLVNSVMMSEDGQFCAHGGVDWNQLNIVINDAAGGEASRGASTITMQTVKNLFLWNGRSYLRKALEIPLALVADTVLSKKRIMEIYLNIAEWGPGIYGIEAAAQHHFKRSASRLTPQQAAYLAVTLPNPLARNPAKPGPGMQRVARIVQGRAQRAGPYVTCVK